MLQTVAFAGQRRLSARFQTAGDDNSASARRMIAMSSGDGAIWPGRVELEAHRRAAGAERTHSIPAVGSAQDTLCAIELELEIGVVKALACHRAGPHGPRHDITPPSAARDSLGRFELHLWLLPKEMPATAFPSVHELVGLVENALRQRSPPEGCSRR